MMREVIECLEGLGGVRVKGYDVLASAEQVLEDVNSRFVVLMVWSHIVR